LGKRLADACCQAPLLDAIVCYFTILPLVIGPLVAGWSGFFVAVIAQLATLLIWQTIHEAVHRDAVKGPRIVKVLNKKFGTVRNLTAVYITAFATPIFWFVRIAQITIYPPLVWLVNLPVTTQLIGSAFHATNSAGLSGTTSFGAFIVIG
jgi:hypothetical protein